MALRAETASNVRHALWVESVSAFGVDTDWTQKTVVRPSLRLCARLHRYAKRRGLATRSRLREALRAGLCVRLFFFRSRERTVGVQTNVRLLSLLRSLLCTLDRG